MLIPINEVVIKWIEVDREEILEVCFILLLLSYRVINKFVVLDNNFGNMPNFNGGFGGGFANFGNPNFQSKSFK